MAGWFDFLTETPEFIKKKAQSAYDAVEPNSVFDPTLERVGKNLARAGIRQAEDAATPLNMIGGAGFTGFGLGVGKRLAKIPIKEHYLDAIRLGKSHDEAIKIAASGGRRAVDKQKFAQQLEKEFGGYKKTPISPYKQTGGAGKSAVELATSIGKNVDRSLGPVKFDPSNPYHRAIKKRKQGEVDYNALRQYDDYIYRPGEKYGK